MDANFRIGRKFKVFKRKQLGKKEEIEDPVVIAYVTRDGLVEVEIEDGVVQKIVNTHSKEIFEKDIYNADEYKFSHKSMIENVMKK